MTNKLLELKKYLKPLLPVWRAWMWLGHILGVINSTIILTAFYFCVVTPIGLLRKLCGNNELGAQSKTSQTYWLKKTSKDFTLEHYTRQF